MGYFFAILGYALYASVNYVDKFVLQKYEIEPAVISIYTGFSALIASLLILLFTGFHLLTFQSASVIIISGILTQFYLLPYFKALTLDEASRVVPLFEMTPIIVLLLGFLFLGEALSLKQYIGAFLIVSSSILLTVEQLEAKIFSIRPALWYMLLTCVLYGSAIFLFKVGLKQDVPFWTALPYEGLGIIIGSLLILGYKNNFTLLKQTTKEKGKKIFLFMSLNDAIFISGRYTQYFALTILSVSFVSVLEGFQPLFALLFGLILSIWFPHLLEEVISKKNVGLKVVAIVLIFSGLYLLFL